MCDEVTDRMFFYATIGILFCYTLLLIGFFMGWCTLIPSKFHSQKELPFASIRSPRRNTRLSGIESISSSTSLEIVRGLTQERSAMQKKCSLPVPLRENRLIDDYLHPKYSLPPRNIDVLQRTWEYDAFLRVPAKPSRSESIPCEARIERLRQKVSECRIQIDEHSVLI
ncbi:unnamed protein product, partial [Mesorhabditis spiculigera]